MSDGYDKVELVFDQVQLPDHDAEPDRLGMLPVREVSKAAFPEGIEIPAGEARQRLGARDAAERLFKRNSSRFLKRVRKFDSCRGHLPVPHADCARMARFMS